MLKISNREERYGHNFADLTLRLIDYPVQEPFEAKVMLDTLYSLNPSLPPAESQAFFHKVMDEYNISRSGNSKAHQASDPYINALQIKFTYAITCHKSQGGQWPAVLIKQGFRQPFIPDKEYLRWLYTAVSRATKICYFVDFMNDLF